MFKLLAVTEAVNKVTAKSHSEDSDVKIVEEENVEKKSVVCKTSGRKGSRGRSHKTHPTKTATKSKNEVQDVKPDIKLISVKDVSVMIAGLSPEELSPEKEKIDEVEIKEETVETSLRNSGNNS